MKIIVPALAALASVLAIAATSPAEAYVKHHKHHVAQGDKVAAHKPLTGTIYGNHRRGGYSYHYSDVVSAGPASDPSSPGSYPSGGLDDDLFYTIPKGPYGGYTPYMH